MKYRNRLHLDMKLQLSIGLMPDMSINLQKDEKQLKLNS